MISREITQAVYDLLSDDKPVTPAGAAYLLRNEFIPQVVSQEIQYSLDWLQRNKYATCSGDNGFGPEYLRGPRVPRG